MTKDKVNLCRHWRQGLITHLTPTCPFCDIDKLKEEAATLAAQRQPLTDGQLYEMYNEPRSDAEMIAFARAIEEAHGIKA